MTVFLRTSALGLRRSSRFRLYGLFFSTTGMGIRMTVSSCVCGRKHRRRTRRARFLGRCESGRSRLRHLVFLATVGLRIRTTVSSCIGVLRVRGTQSLRWSTRGRACLRLCRLIFFSTSGLRLRTVVSSSVCVQVLHRRRETRSLGGQTCGGSCRHFCLVVFFCAGGLRVRVALFA